MRPCDCPLETTFANSWACYFIGKPCLDDGKVRCGRTLRGQKCIYYPDFRKSPYPYQNGRKVKWSKDPAQSSSQFIKTTFPRSYLYFSIHAKFEGQLPATTRRRKFPVTKQVSHNDELQLKNGLASLPNEKCYGRQNAQHFAYEYIAKRQDDSIDYRRVWLILNSATDIGY